MATKDIASWLLAEHERVRELADALRARLTPPPRGDRTEWIAGVRKQFEHFRAHVFRHMGLEEEGGYLAPVLELRPALTRQVAELEHEHRELRQLMDGIHDALLGLGTDDRILMRDCCTRMQLLLGHIERHEEHENHIALYAFTQDIGTKD